VGIQKKTAETSETSTSTSSLINDTHIYLWCIQLKNTSNDTFN
jgi:hypothetical protein